MDFQITVQNVEIHQRILTLEFDVDICKEKIENMRLTLFFVNKHENRIFPVQIVEKCKQNGIRHFSGSIQIDLSYVFRKSNAMMEKTEVYLNFFYNNELHEKISQVIFSNSQIIVNSRMFEAFVEKNSILITQIKKIKREKSIQTVVPWLKNEFPFVSRLYWKSFLLNFMYKNARKKSCFHEKQVCMISQRSDCPTGNIANIYDQLKNHLEIYTNIICVNKDIIFMTWNEMKQIARTLAESKVIVIDDYTSFLYRLDLDSETKIIQVWHACGAFKTFGFSRIGKQNGLRQNSPVHRNYDYSVVSSESVVPCYAEGFGIPLDHVLPLGVPRTDVLLNKIYAEETKKRLYEKYAIPANRKLVLFAPTFRGQGLKQADFPMERFDVAEFCREMPEEFFLIIKHHPFVKRKHPISQECKDRVLDLSCEDEVNDLLFISDFIITDYSSLIFEASLLKIPMFFYSFDLQEYVHDRDFYFEYETFVPGKIYYSLKEMLKDIRNKEYEIEKIEAFSRKFFDKQDGRASERVVEIINNLLIKKGE